MRILKELDLDDVRQVFVDLTRQGHHLVAFLVRADYDREVLNFADGIGIQTGVAIVMRSLTHAVELIWWLFQHTEYRAHRLYG